jgi:hypothetical protein
MIYHHRWDLIVLLWPIVCTGCLGSLTDTAFPSSLPPTYPSEETSNRDISTPFELATPPRNPSPVTRTALEQPIQEIPISGPLATSDAQVSGLAWFGDSLVLLPQYPSWFPAQNTTGSLFTLSKAEILAFLEEPNSTPLIPDKIPFNDGEISTIVSGFEGFEAIAFSGDLVFLTIEARINDTWVGFLVSGSVETDLAGISLNPDSLTPIPAPVDIVNKSNEALVVAGDKIVSLYEANGETVNPNPTAHIFDRQTLVDYKIPIQSVEYRITDATPADENGQFWALNIFWPGEFWLLPLDDPLADRFGEGITHSTSSGVERLVKLSYTSQGISLADQAPILLELTDPDNIRNWEGLALLDQHGFLIITDEFPETILAFVEVP